MYNSMPDLCPQLHKQYLELLSLHNEFELLSKDLDNIANSQEGKGKIAGLSERKEQIEKIINDIESLIDNVSTLPYSSDPPHIEISENLEPKEDKVFTKEEIIKLIKFVLEKWAINPKI